MRLKRTLALLLLITPVLLLAAPSFNLTAHAAGDSSGSDTSSSESTKDASSDTASKTYKLKNPLGETTTIAGLAGSIVKTAVGLIGAIALLMFVYGGFLWLTSGGAPDRVKKGKDVMVWAVIGLAIVFSSVALVSFVLGALSK